MIKFWARFSEPWIIAKPKGKLLFWFSSHSEYCYYYSTTITITIITPLQLLVPLPLSRTFPLHYHYRKHYHNYHQYNNRTTFITVTSLISLMTIITTTNTTVPGITTTSLLPHTLPPPAINPIASIITTITATTAITE